jgi:hypothetical protein
VAAPLLSGGVSSAAADLTEGAPYRGNEPVEGYQSLAARPAYEQVLFDPLALGRQGPAQRVTLQRLLVDVLRDAENDAVATTVTTC